MTYYLIYLNNLGTNEIEYKDHYFSYSDALENLELTAYNYIKDLQGNEQASICKQLNVNDIKNTKKSGLYFINNTNCIELYEKDTTINYGLLWDSQESKVNKIGLFNILTFKKIDNVKPISITPIINERKKLNCKIDIQQNYKKLCMQELSNVLKKKNLL